jgi:5-methylcytosine-specific restriction enzyme subunit McrC
MEAKGGLDRDAVGVLLYAAARQHLDLRHRLGGHDVLVRTLELDRPWEMIRASLLGLVADVSMSPMANALAIPG